MKSEACSRCEYYEGGDCYDDGRSTPIQNVFQCGIADKIFEEIYPTHTFYPDKEKEKSKEEILKIALNMACERISDSGQEYHEAKTKKGWVNHYLKCAKKLFMERP